MRPSGGVVSSAVGETGALALASSLASGRIATAALTRRSAVVVVVPIVCVIVIVVIVVITTRGTLADANVFSNADFDALVSEGAGKASRFWEGNVSGNGHVRGWHSPSMPGNFFAV